jgi:arsenite methyltransferase
MYYQYLGAENLAESDTITINGCCYFKRHGLLRQDELCTREQEQTRDAFAYKWKKSNTYNSNTVKDKARRWLFERYLGNDPNLLAGWFTSGSKVLDAGCGAAFSAQLLFGDYINSINYLGIDISEAVDVAVSDFVDSNLKGEFIQADILKQPFKKPFFDIIFSEGVLHHTQSTERALKYLSTLLLPGGLFLFYVYNKKGPIREFTDDHIRSQLQNLSDQEAWDQLMPLTKLGKAIGDLDLSINVPDDIPMLGISAGKVNLQRLLYWYILKAYYDRDYTLDEMNHINFDWYRPLNCHRQSPEQVKKWCSEAGLSIERLDVQDASITVVARKSSSREVS